MEMVSQKIISKWKSFTYKVTFLKGKPFRGRKQLVSGVGNHFLDPYFSFTKVVVISLMGSRNHFLGPHFSFTKVVVRSLMGSGNKFDG